MIRNGNGDWRQGKEEMARWKNEREKKPEEKQNNKSTKTKPHRCLRQSLDSLSHTLRTHTFDTNNNSFAFFECDIFMLHMYEPDEKKFTYYIWPGHNRNVIFTPATVQCLLINVRHSVSLSVCPNEEMHSAAERFTQQYKMLARSVIFMKHVINCSKLVGCFHFDLVSIETNSVFRYFTFLGSTNRES